MNSENLPRHDGMNYDWNHFHFIDEIDENLLKIICNIRMGLVKDNLIIKNSFVSATIQSEYKCAYINALQADGDRLVVVDKIQKYFSWLWSLFVCGVIKTWKALKFITQPESGDNA